MIGMPRQGRSEGCAGRPGPPPAQVTAKPSPHGLTIEQKIRSRAVAATARLYACQGSIPREEMLTLADQFAAYIRDGRQE